MLQMLHLGVLNDLANTDHKVEAEMKTQLQKSAGRDQQPQEDHKEE